MGYRAGQYGRLKRAESLDACVRRVLEGSIEGWGLTRTLSRRLRNPIQADSRGQNAHSRSSRNILRVVYVVSLGRMDAARLCGQTLCRVVPRGTEGLDDALYGCRRNEDDESNLYGSAGRRVV
jgi:hypothetical protein